MSGTHRSATSTAAAARAVRGDTAPAPALASTVTVSVMDSFVSAIPDMSADNVEAKFPHKTLHKIEGQPTYAGLFQLLEEVYQNALTSKSQFGGGDRKHLGAAMSSAAYTIMT